MVEEQVSCRCGSGLEYDQCCGRFHSGERQPPNAESLMRSRFTAFAMRNETYLLATWEAGAMTDHPQGLFYIGQLNFLMICFARRSFISLPQG